MSNMPVGGDSKGWGPEVGVCPVFLRPGVQGAQCGWN